VYGTRVVQAFMREVLPTVPDEKRVLAGDMVMMTLSTVGKRLSEEDRTEQDVEARAGELANMFRAYLEQLAASGPGGCGASRAVRPPRSRHWQGNHQQLAPERHVDCAVVQEQASDVGMANLVDGETLGRVERPDTHGAVGAAGAQQPA
jgi:hypothetical protein